ncbi:nuclear transport factor 2 family protein [Rhodococcus sp. X156]|uniref:nuclear transport factor 2 family protein n=1 Tax=Rhodococcus sp. X156 TaxID=2499145 RepID=UPI000FDC7CD4|nr:nuclear transport factor 2 family protein [Rhodococcus sp. X156]
MTPPALTTSLVEQLLAIEEIKRLFAQRLRVMDTKQWDHYGELHTADVVSEAYVGRQVIGREALTRAIRTTLDGPTTVTSVHHGHTPEIVLDSDTTAHGTWAMEDKLWWRNGDQDELLHGFGHYHEQYRKVDGAWLISHRRLTRLRVDTTPGFYDYRSAST